MRAYVLYGVGDLRLEEVGMPLPREDEVLVRVKAAGICGSDVPRVFETGAHRHPLIIGHEFSGVVEGIGREINAAWLGRRVGVFPLIPCRKCDSCHKGQYELCQNYDYLGSRRDGGFAEYVCVPAENLVELPGNVSFKAAAMLEPMAVAVHAIRRGTGNLTLSRSAVVTVCGLGTIGILIVMFLMEAGYQNIYVVGNKEFQREKINSIGIAGERYCDSRKKDVCRWLWEYAGGADVFFECTGKNQICSLGIESVKPEGKVVLVGNPCSDMLLEKACYWRILRNQLTVTGIWNSSFTGEENDDWHYVLRRLETCRLRPEVLITHCLSFEHLARGLDIMRDRREASCKIMILS